MERRKLVVVGVSIGTVMYIINILNNKNIE